jgi:RNA-directed DNA polymerase
VDSPAVIRYADDFVVHCHTRQDALEIKAKLAAWLASRGLAFDEDKTRVVCLDEGFDFLGFNVRRYRGKLLIKPSKPWRTNRGPASANPPPQRQG